MICVMGIDPGFANVGWSIVDIDCFPFEVVDVNLFSSVKSSKKLRVLSANDDFRRMKEMAECLFRVCEEYDVKMICAESFSAPPNARTSNLLSACWGVLASICQSKEIPMSQVSPQIIKRNLCGRMNAKDADLHIELIARYPELKAAVTCVAKSKREHLFDSVGAIEACKNGEVFMAMRKALQCR